MIKKVLIANRGEIARRVIRGARSLGIRTVAVYSDADEASLHVLEADEAVRLTGNLPSETYLVAERILDAAAATGADAVHPGYGFLSENADFAAACEAAGLTFVGPPAEAIRQMGDKLGAKALMAERDVPLLRSITVADDTPVSAEALAEVGFPAIIKASAGGGGRGMRIVRHPDEVPDALASARREAAAAFGDPTLFIERYLSPSRHIEIQVMADRHGQVATLFERECSIQRRHQKLVEESPSPFVEPALRERLCTAAAEAARAVAYVGAGTVEFVVSEDGTAAFLEMNTRLQVEHPVTEAVTGLDLVRWQFKVAAGEPLGEELLHPTLRGHAIEVRLCAEDPAAGHLPAAGTFSLFEVDTEGIRVDSAVRSGSTVSPFYDSMVAKVIAWGETRDEAAAKLAGALERARIHGVATNRDLLARVLRSRPFLDGDTTTDFLERVPGLTDPRTDREAHRVHAAIASVALAHAEQTERTVQPAIPVGWRNNPSGPEKVQLSIDGEELSVLSSLTGPHAEIEVDDEHLDVRIDHVEPGCISATVGGVRRRYRHTVLADAVLIDSDLGSTLAVRVDRFPQPEDLAARGGLEAPMPGRVVRVHVSPGQEVAAGDALLVLEAMKMEHTISSPADGTVAAINVAEGDQVERGAVLAVVDVASAE